MAILSGLYGVVLASDWIRPYRLEMGSKWQPDPTHPNLASYWQSFIRRFLHQHCQKYDISLIINLASQEYAQAVDWSWLHNHGIASWHIKFSQPTLTQPSRSIGFTNKRARGALTRLLLDESHNGSISTAQMQQTTPLQHRCTAVNPRNLSNSALSSSCATDWVFSL